MKFKQKSLGSHDVRQKDINNKRKGSYTWGAGGLYSSGLIFGWKNALLIWGAYIRGSLYTGRVGGGGLFTEFFGIIFLT